MACIDFARFTYSNNNMQNAKVLQQALLDESKLKNVIVCTVVYNINGRARVSEILASILLIFTDRYVSVAGGGIQMENRNWKITGEIYFFSPFFILSNNFSPKTYWPLPRPSRILCTRVSMCTAPKSLWPAKDH